MLEATARIYFNRPRCPIAGEEFEVKLTPDKVKYLELRCGRSVSVACPQGSTNEVRATGENGEMAFFVECKRRHDCGVWRSIYGQVE